MQAAYVHKVGKLSRCTCRSVVAWRGSVPGSPCAHALASGTVRASNLVKLDFHDLLSDSRNRVSYEVVQAFGHGGMGIMLVQGIPGYVELRNKLLHCAHSLVSLDGSALSCLKDPGSAYQVGFSSGVETLAASSQPDKLKASFYVNPLRDDRLTPSPSDPWDAASCFEQQLRAALLSDAAGPSVAGGSAAAAARCIEEVKAWLRPRGEVQPAELEGFQRQYPGFLRPNVWPREALPELEEDVVAMGRLLWMVGVLVMAQCDRYLTAFGSQPGSLVASNMSGYNHKARLLYYYPLHSAAHPAAASPNGGGATPSSHDALGGQRGDGDAWCSIHTDLCSLTALAGAMYLDAEGREVAKPDEEAGLYIKGPDGGWTLARIPPDCVAFQVGDALQVQSGGRLRATAHYVRAAQGPAAAGIARSTFALFMQPEVWAPLEPVVPLGTGAGAWNTVGVSKWRPPQTFGEFARKDSKAYQ